MAVVANLDIETLAFERFEHGVLREGRKPFAKLGAALEGAAIHYRHRPLGRGYQFRKTTDYGTFRGGSRPRPPLAPRFPSGQVCAVATKHPDGRPPRTRR